MAARGRRRTRLCASTKGVWLERALRVVAREAPLERDVVRGHVGAQRRVRAQLVEEALRLHGGPSHREQSHAEWWAVASHQ